MNQILACGDRFRKMLLIRAGCSLSFIPERRAGMPFSTASPSAPSKSQLDNGHKAVPGPVISISFSLRRHPGNDAWVCLHGRCFFLQTFASSGWEVGRHGNRKGTVAEAPSEVRAGLGLGTAALCKMEQAPLFFLSIPRRPISECCQLCKL